MFLIGKCQIFLSMTDPGEALCRRREPTNEPGEDGANKEENSNEDGDSSGNQDNDGSVSILFAIYSLKSSYV